ncbi:hypothetical protein DPMN_120994 [Dreissena polymorpha]|uniref:Uncharacterized protein n=1 Tax=Dreissena polymorpha TaxID=45954 RepID=A0A9D4JP29_DREPO|nr:hypothetical protein DPMN_120994 [Dreissena polymorpha]
MTWLLILRTSRVKSISPIDRSYSSGSKITHSRPASTSTSTRVSSTAEPPTVAMPTPTPPRPNKDRVNQCG